jgi:LacI family transcriptional regulator
MARPPRPSVSEGGVRRLAAAGVNANGFVQKPTIDLVAERAEVAISTVSRVINGHCVSAAVKHRVQRVIDELGYSPSVAAQSLAHRRAGCIGLAVNSTQSRWFLQILGGLEEALLPSKKSLLLASLALKGNYDPGAVLAWLLEGRIDGLVLVRCSQRDRPLFEAAEKAGVPIVLMMPDVAVPAEFTVRCDNVNGGWLVAEHLVKLGHREVAFVGGPIDSLDTRHRLQGLEDGLREHGISLAPERVWFAPTYAWEMGAHYAENFLRVPQRKRASAVVLANDAMAVGFMRTLLQSGVSVPGSVSVVGFNGTPEGEQIWPGLTTVVQPTRLMAITACQALLDRVARRLLDRNTATEFAVELVVRESTAAPPPAD